jgi:hypothetical protein
VQLGLGLGAVQVQVRCKWCGANVYNHGHRLKNAKELKKVRMLWLLEWKSIAYLLVLWAQQLQFGCSVECMPQQPSHGLRWRL